MAKVQIKQNRQEKKVRLLTPQKGPQERFLSTRAQICIYGGAAGGGKTYGILLTQLRYKNVDGFGCTIFRKNHNQIFSQGGLWDEARKMYAGIKGAQPKISESSWVFNDKNGKQVSKISFAHIERDEDLEKWQGSQICSIGFDELCHFSEHQFFYMLSRNRSTCGVEPFIRATCNPDADSWVAKFIEWWIDQETGYPIPERSGVIRWMLRRDEIIYWGGSKEELIERFDLKGDEREDPKSVTFIMSSVEDNKELLKVNKGYLANLRALPLLERERLLKGNWKIRAAAGLFFKRSQVGDILEIMPADVICWVRCWDLAATEKSEDGKAAYTAGVLIGKRKNGRYLIADVINKQMAASEVRKTIKLTAQADRAAYKRVRIRLPKDPGQAGKEQAESYIKFLAGFDVVAVAETGSKEARAEPMAAQWQAGNFDILYGPWNEEYLLQLENFPDSQTKDMVDASANGFAEIEVKSQFNVSNLI